MTVSDRDVQNELVKVKQMFMGDEAKFDGGSREAEHHARAVHAVAQETASWLERMKAAVTRDVTVTDDETQQYYEQHKAEYVEQESREVRHILISPFAKQLDKSVSTVTPLKRSGTRPRARPRRCAARS